MNSPNRASPAERSDLARDEPTPTPEALPSGWREIESAPRDGTAFLIWIEPGWIDVAHWAYRYSRVGGLMNHENSRATHWMPLPPPPADAKVLK